MGPIAQRPGVFAQDRLRNLGVAVWCTLQIVKPRHDCNVQSSPAPSTVIGPGFASNFNMAWEPVAISAAAEAALRSKFPDGICGLRAVAQPGAAAATEYCAVCRLQSGMVTVHYCEVAGGVVKEVTAGAANKADLNVKEPVGTWPGDAVFIPWVDAIVANWTVDFGS